MEAAKCYCMVYYREDVTGISDAKMVGGKFATIEEATAYHAKNALACENSYYCHLAEQQTDGHFYFLGDHQIVYLSGIM